MPATEAQDPCGEIILIFKRGELVDSVSNRIERAQLERVITPFAAGQVDDSLTKLQQRLQAAVEQNLSNL
ncbi:MAG: hypothetical protein ACK2T2_11345 [Anaerolineales bacterium]